MVVRGIVGNLRIVSAAVTLVLGLLLWVGLHRSAADYHGRTFKIGIGNALPYTSFSAGKAEGFAVDIIEAAARRIGVQLQWIPTSAPPEKAIPEHAVDLFAMTGITPERSKKIHISDPWLNVSYCLISLRRTNLITPAEVKGKTVAFSGYPMAERTAKAALPGAKLTAVRRRREVLESVCAGQADAGFEEVTYINQLVLDGSTSCVGKPLSIGLVRGAVGADGIGSRLEDAPVADALREQISNLAADGKLIEVLDRWSSFSASETRSILAMQSLESRARLTRYALWGSGLALLLLAWQVRSAYRARRSAEQASRSKSEFLANMSHEIRTPLNGIMGLTEIVLDGELSQDQRECLTLVRVSADSLMSILNDILDFSRIEAGKLEISESTFDLRSCVDATIQSLALKAQQKGVPIRQRVANEVPRELIGDAGRIRQVLLNLAGNALKFTASGSIDVTVDGKPVDGGAWRLHFSVRDTGIGIPADKVAAIFDPFTQADGSITRKYGGTGLGLTICSRLVKLMGGAIWAENNRDQGSTFHFTAELKSMGVRERNETDDAAVRYANSQPASLDTGSAVRAAFGIPRTPRQRASISDRGP